MDWSRAKNILIIALVIANLMLGRSYLNKEREKQEQISTATDYAIEYIENRGINISCAVPRETEDLTVITLQFKPGENIGGLARTSFEGIPVEILGLSSAEYIEVIRKTDVVIETIPAYTALLQSLEDIHSEIDDIELIYLVDHTEYSGAGQDTAFPYWKISSGHSSYYYNAFLE